MKTVIFICSLFFFSIVAKCQPSPQRTRIEEVRVAYVTHYLQLTKSESKKFWPIYDEYMKSVGTIKSVHYADVAMYNQAINQLNHQYFAPFKGILGSSIRVNKTFRSDSLYRYYVHSELVKRRKKTN